MNANFTKGKLMKFNRIATFLAVGIAVSIGVPALAGVQWITADDGSKPSSAVVGGTDNGDPLYVCQFVYGNGRYTPGKLAPKYKNCYISYGGKERFSNKYRVLFGSNWKWVSFTTSQRLPANLVWGGDDTKTTIYICRAKLSNEYTPGKYYPPSKACLVTGGGKSFVYKSGFQLLTAK